MIERKEQHKFRAWWVGGWFWPIFTAVATLVWCLLIYFLIGDRPANWKYGTVPYVPGDSPYSIERIPPGAPPAQVVLPEVATGGSNAQR